MSELAEVFQIIQLAPEVTAGSAVGATRQLRSMMLTPAPQGAINAFKASGYKWNTLTQINQEWTQFNLSSGGLSPNELIYPLSGVISSGTVTTAGTGAGGTAYTWTFNTASSSADAFQTYTIERGDSNRAQNYPGVVFTDLTLTVDRTNAQISGQAIGQRMNDGISLSGTAVLINQSIVAPGGFNIYIEDSQAALATATAITRGFQAVFAVSGRQVPIWPVNSSYTSYATTVESTGSDATMQITLAADSTGMGLLTTMRNNARKFIRLKGTGGTSVAGTAAYYSVQVDFSGQVSTMPSQQAMDQINTAQWTFTAVPDSTWGHAFQVVVVNDMSGF